MKFLCLKFNILYSKNNYGDILSYFVLSVLKYLRSVFDYIFIYRVLSAQINCPSFVDNFIPFFAKYASHVMGKFLEPNSFFSLDRALFILKTQ